MKTLVYISIISMLAVNPHQAKQQKHAKLLINSTRTSQLGSKRHLEKHKLLLRPDEKQETIANKKIHRLKHIIGPSAAQPSEFEEFKRNYLNNIMRVRIPGTVGHHEVQQFIVTKLKEFGWHVELDDFVDTTPLGDRKFTNIIAKLNPDAERELAVAAHYDSKIMTPDARGKHFIAATDSAVPCAMMLDFAKHIAEDAKRLHFDVRDVTPMLLFLDGEEAFVEWSKSDSIYGARHLAKLFANKTHSLTNTRSYAQSMEAFILLDLLGSAAPEFYDFYPRTSHLYNRLGQIEWTLHQEGKIDNKFPYFVGKRAGGVFVEDDHLPFLQTGVPILHVIPIPFPDVWHRLSDDESAVDPATVVNLMKIFRAFFSEYFHLDK